MRGLAAILLVFVLGVSSPADSKGEPNGLCQIHTKGPAGATYGWLNLIRAPNGKILSEEYQMGFEAWRFEGSKSSDDPVDSVSFDAVWDLRDGRLDRTIPMREFSATAQNFSDLPMPVRIVMMLDGKPAGATINRQVAENSFARSGPSGADGQSGTPGGFFVGNGGAVPSVFGHRRLELVAYNGSGQEIRRAQARLPNWRRLASAVHAVSTEAHESSCSPDIPVD